MAECWVDQDNGNDANPGTEALPWKLIPGQAGANAFSGGSAGNPNIINVKNGTTGSVRLLPTANYLLYRGYGISDNVLTLTLPATNDPSQLVTERVVRTPGVHEGMWKLVDLSTTTSMIALDNRVGVTIEDVYVEKPLATQAVSFGTSSSTGNSPTLRRSHIKGADGNGLVGYQPGFTVEYVKIENIQDDAIVMTANATNSYRAGYTDRFRCIDIVEPGTDTGTAIGDALQTVPTTTRYESGLSIYRMHVYKSSAVKQALQLNDATAGFLIDCFHFEAPNDTGTLSTDIAHIKGRLEIRNGYISRGGGGNALFRLNQDTGVVTTAGAVIKIRNITAEATNIASFYTQGAPVSASTHDGTVIVEHCTAIGNNPSGLSYAAGISGHPGSNVTIGAGASLVVRNNAMLLTGTPPAVLLPTGKAGSALYPVKGNAALDAATYGIGGTSYATLALFEAAHSQATGNTAVADSDAALLSTGRPLPSSPLRAAGTHSTYMRDAAGLQRPNPPSIGAYDLPTQRRVLDSDPAGW